MGLRTYLAMNGYHRRGNYGSVHISLRMFKTLMIDDGIKLGMMLHGMLVRFEHEYDSPEPRLFQGLASP